MEYHIYGEQVMQKPEKTASLEHVTVVGCLCVCVCW